MKGNLHQGGFSGGLKQASAGDVTGIFDLGLEAAGRDALSLEIRSSPVLYGSSSMLPLRNFQLRFLVSWPPRLLHLACGDMKPRQQAVTVRSFVTSDSSHTCCWYREQRICSWGPASEPCAFLLSRVRTWPHPQQRGVVCPRWYLTDVIKDTLPDCLWSWLCVYFYWFKTCLFSSQPFLIKQRVSVQSYLSVGTLSKGLLEHEKVLGKMDNARQKYEKGKWVHG